MPPRSKDLSEFLSRLRTRLEKLSVFREDSSWLDKWFEDLHEALSACSPVDSSGAETDRILADFQEKLQQHMSLQQRRSLSRRLRESPREAEKGGLTQQHRRIFDFDAIDRAKESSAAR